MRRLLLIIGLLTSLAIVQVTFAQNSQGVITYEDKVNMHRRLPPERQDMKAMIPEYRSNNYQLFFNAEESLYKPVPEDEEEPFANSGGGGMRMRFRMQSSEIYLNHNVGVMTSKQEFNGKEYLVLDTVKVSPWKFGADTKVILGYECKQAYYTDETVINRNGNSNTEKREITAWYTDKIRPFLGPDRNNTLPGAILALDVNNGERVTVATKVELRDLKKNELKAPTKGEKISQAAFRKMMEEQFKKMNANGGGAVIIRN